MVVLGVSNDAPAKNKDFHEKFDFNFDLLSDESAEMGAAYGAADAPGAPKLARISYIIDPRGKVQKAYATVNAAEHPEQVLSDLGG